jgi:hypothetical protein
VRTPHSGIQPRAAVDSHGRIHLLYYTGAPDGGDLLYVRSDDAGKTFGAPLAVNHRPKSAVAIGTIRGAQLAIGKNGRVHVAWNGTPPPAPKHEQAGPEPMLYSRLDDAGRAFETERDVIAHHHGLDGGGSVAADEAGNVWVVWHAPDEGDDEANRRVWVRHSSDEGRTFSDESAADEAGSGVCPCCALGTVALDDGGLAILYRRAKNEVDRDTVLLRCSSSTSEFVSRVLDPWRVPACVMSTYSLSRARAAALGAWETEGEIHFADLGGEVAILAAPRADPASKTGRKHPSITRNASGVTLLAWIEGSSWGEGGTLAWQLFDAKGAPLAEASRREEPLGPWSLVQALSLPSGSFVLLY